MFLWFKAKFLVDVTFTSVFVPILNILSICYLSLWGLQWFGSNTTSQIILAIKWYIGINKPYELISFHCLWWWFINWAKSFSWLHQHLGTRWWFSCCSTSFDVSERFIKLIQSNFLLHDWSWRYILLRKWLWSQFISRHLIIQWFLFCLFQELREFSRHRFFRACIWLDYVLLKGWNLMNTSFIFDLMEFNVEVWFTPWRKSRRYQWLCYRCHISFRKVLNCYLGSICCKWRCC